jgi:hypothetical protein
MKQSGALLWLLPLVAGLNYHYWPNYNHKYPHVQLNADMQVREEEEWFVSIKMVYRLCNPSMGILILWHIYPLISVCPQKVLGGP